MSEKESTTNRIENAGAQEAGVWRKWEKKYLSKKWIILHNAKCPECGGVALVLRRAKSAPQVTVDVSRGDYSITFSYEIVCPREGCTFDHIGWAEKIWRD